MTLRLTALHFKGKIRSRGTISPRFLISMRFDILTLIPDALEPYAKASILGRAQKNALISITSHQLRKYSKDPHKKVDDTPYGGGAGMVMTVQPIADAVKKIRRKRG